jgi:hypothetical protein
MSCIGLTGKALLDCKKKNKLKASPAQKGDMYYDNQYYDKSHMRKTPKPKMKDLPLGSTPRMEEYVKRGWRLDSTVSNAIKRKAKK